MKGFSIFLRFGIPTYAIHFLGIALPPVDLKILKKCSNKFGRSNHEAISIKRWWENAVYFIVQLNVPIYLYSVAS